METRILFQFAPNRRWMDDGPLVYYKLTLWAFCWGELKIQTPEKFAVITQKYEQGGLTVE